MAGDIRMLLIIREQDTEIGRLMATPEDWHRIVGGLVLKTGEEQARYSYALHDPENDRIPVDVWFSDQLSLRS